MISDFSYQAISPKMIYLSTVGLFIPIMLFSIIFGIDFLQKYRYKWAPIFFIAIGLIVFFLALLKTENLSQFSSLTITSDTLEITYALPPKTISLSHKDIRTIQMIDHRIKIQTDRKTYQSGVIFRQDQEMVISKMNYFLKN